MVTRLYAEYFKHALTGKLNWLSDEIGVVPVGEAYVFDATQVTLDQLTDVKEVTGVPPIVLTNKSVAVDGAVTVLRADGVKLTGATVQGVKGLVVYKKTAEANTSLLLEYVDLGLTRGVTNGEFEIAWDASGIITHTEG